jgi:hypothetical protein
MNHLDRLSETGSGRLQWGRYGFVAGLILGVLIGWMFSGVVATIVRFGILLAIIVPLIALYVVWRKFLAPWLRPPAERPDYGPADAIETRAVVQRTVREPIRR